MEGVFARWRCVDTWEVCWHARYFYWWAGGHKCWESSPEGWPHARKGWEPLAWVFWNKTSSVSFQADRIRRQPAVGIVFRILRNVTSRYASQYEDKKREEWKLDNVDNFTAGDLKEVLSDAVILVKPCLMALPSAFRQQLNLLCRHFCSSINLLRYFWLSLNETLFWFCFIQRLK